MHESVLAHVAASLPQKENLATSALTYILNRSEPARLALQALIAAAVGPFARIGALRCEQQNADAKRPDVLLIGESGERVGFIEVKFWAGLTDAQPVAYLRDLVAGDGGVLVMLAPDRRLPNLRNEVVLRCEAASMPIASGPNGALVCGTTQIAFLAWSHLLDHLARATVDDRRASADLDQLRSLCEQMETEGYVSLTREEIDDLATPRRYLMLAGVVDDIIARALAEGIGSTKRLKATARAEGPGRYLALPRAVCWVGLDHIRWARHGQSPIWLHFWPGDEGRGEQVAGVLRSWLLVNPPRAHRGADDDVLRIPVPLLPGATKDDILRGVMALFREINAALVAGGIPPLRAWDAVDEAPA